MQQRQNEWPLAQQQPRECLSLWIPRTARWAVQQESCRSLSQNHHDRRLRRCRIRWRSLTQSLMMRTPPASSWAIHWWLLVSSRALHW